MTQATFHWDDALLLNQQLSPEERIIRDTAYASCQSHLAPRIQDNLRQANPDPGIFREMGGLGLLGATIPKEYGGSGLNHVSHGLIAREVERVDSGFRSLLSVQNSLVMPPVHRFGTEAQKQKFLPQLTTGEWIGCFGLIEPGLDSDSSKILTHAKKVAGGYELSGHKIWIRNSPIADVFVVWAKEVSDSGATGPIRGFILEKGMRGLSAPAMQMKVGLHSNITGEIVMDKVFCPEENALPDSPELKPSLFLNGARYAIAWGALGAAEDCWHRTRQFTLEHKQFGWPLAANQDIQKKLGDMQISITLGLQGCLRLGRTKDEGGIADEMITLLMKRNSCSKALDIARLARDIMNDNSIIDENGIIRHLINLEVVNTYEGAHNLHVLPQGPAQTVEEQVCT